jgi:hypothetical protein
LDTIQPLLTLGNIKAKQYSFMSDSDSPGQHPLKSCRNNSKQMKRLPGIYENAGRVKTKR